MLHVFMPYIKKIGPAGAPLNIKPTIYTEGRLTALKSNVKVF